MLFYWLCQTGIESNPGPGKVKVSQRDRRNKKAAQRKAKAEQKSILGEVGNITHFIQQKDWFADRNANTFLGQEDSIPRNRRKTAKMMCDKRLKNYLSYLDAEADFFCVFLLS